MSLITRCPSCGTMFKVVPDQLRISEGWVRCGHCAEIFDGPANFHDPNAAPPMPDVVPVPEVVGNYSANSDDTSSYGIDNTGYANFNDAPVPQDPPFVFDDPAVEVIDISLGSDLPAAEVQEAPAPAAFAEAIPDAGMPDAGLQTEPEADVPTEAESEAPPAPATPSFVKQADRKAFWRLPLVRGVLTLVFLVLALALGLQAVYQERDRIATLLPASRPALVQLCALAGCEVGALRRIESITIDGSSFTRLRADAYRLSIILKNNTSIDLAMPSVELTLTDTQDQSVIRRVLSPADMGATATLAAGAEWSGMVPIAVTAAGGAARVAGYRVLAFYP